MKLPDQVCLELPALLGFPHLEVLRYYAGISRPSALRLLMNLMTSDPGGPCTQEGPWSSGFLFLFICLFACLFFNATAFELKMPALREGSPLLSQVLSAQS